MKDEQENKDTRDTAGQMNQHEKGDKIHDELEAVKSDNIPPVACKDTLLFPAYKVKAQVIESNEQCNQKKRKLRNIKTGKSTDKQYCKNKRRHKPTDFNEPFSPGNKFLKNYSLVFIDPGSLFNAIVIMLYFLHRHTPVIIASSCNSCNADPLLIYLISSMSSIFCISFLISTGFSNIHFAGHASPRICWN